MRKQTKLLAVLSASAVLAAGAGVTSYAATKGWVESDGVWQYLDSDGDPVTEEWKKSGSQYFWLDENGEMATDVLVEDDDVYYVDVNGARVVNEWRQVDNEDGWTNGDNDEEPESIWYYFGSNGKAVTGKKTINGKVYIFDEEGEMFSNWTDYDDKTYYLGQENEGWAYTGWQYLEFKEEYEDEYDDDEGWFHFKTNGEIRKADSGEDTKRVYINGAYYGFDQNGVMVDGWVPEYESTSTGSAYYTDENGDQKKGWVYTYANTEDGEDDDPVWYYLNSKGKPFNVGGYYTDDYSKDSTGVVQEYENGEPVGDEITQVAAKVISSKTYLFDNTGAMLDGVYEFLTDVDRVGGSGNLKAGIYYFDNSEGSTNGRMQTGKTTVTEDGESNYYYFDSTGKAYANMIADNSLYKANGTRVDSEDSSKTVYEINSSEFTDTITVKGSTSITLEEGDRVIVSSSGKLKKSGTVTIDGTKYTVSDYVVTGEE